jgi:integrase
MAQASVLTDAEIRRVCRIIETTRHANRNRLAFVLSLYAGLRVGEIAALMIGDVLTQKGEVRREIKLGAHQTKGSRGRTVVLSSRVGTEIAAASVTFLTSRARGVHTSVRPGRHTRDLRPFVACHSWGWGDRSV